MFLCFLSFCGLSSPDCIGFGVYCLCALDFFWAFQPTVPQNSWREYPAYRSWRDCSPKNPGGNIQPTDPKEPGGTVHPKILEGISSLQILEGLFPKKSWREYPAYRSWRDCSPKNPGGNIQPTDPKKTGGNVPQKILEGLSSPQFPKNCRDYPVHTSPKKSWKDYPVHSSPKNPWRYYPVHSSQKNPAGTIQSTIPKKTLQGLSSPHFPKKILEGLSSPQFPKNPWTDYPVHSSQKNPAGTIQSTLPKKTLQGLSSPHFPKKSWTNYPVHSFQKKNPDAFSPSAGLRFAKPSLHRSVPGILPAVLVPAVFFLASQPGSLKKRLSSQKLGRLSKAKGQSLPIWLSAHTFSKSPYCYRTSASCSLALSHLSASCCGPQS